MIRPIRLTEEQQIDVDLALATEDFDGLEADSAAYVSHSITHGAIPEGKIVGRTCENGYCVNPEHLVLVSK